MDTFSRAFCAMRYAAVTLGKQPKNVSENIKKALSVNCWRVCNIKQTPNTNHRPPTNRRATTVFVDQLSLQLSANQSKCHNNKKNVATCYRLSTMDVASFPSNSLFTRGELQSSFVVRTLGVVVAPDRESRVNSTKSATIRRPSKLETKTKPEAR